MTHALRLAGTVGALVLLLNADSARGQAPADPKSEEARAGQLFLVAEPFRPETVQDLRAAVQPLLDQGAANNNAPILIFEFAARGARPGQTTLGAAMDVVDVLSTEFGSAQYRVSYVPELLAGYAVLAALSCDELVMGPDAALGPILPPDEQRSREDLEQIARKIARISGLEEDLILGMLVPDEDLRLIRTRDNRSHFVLASKLDAFKQANPVQSDEPAWDDGARGILSAARAREWRISKATVADRLGLLGEYKLARSAITNNPTLGKEIKPMWITIGGVIDAVKREHIERQLARARAEGANLIVFEINSNGGVLSAADDLANLIFEQKDARTIAFINDEETEFAEATGAAVLVVLACDEIVMSKGSRIGEFQWLLDHPRSRPQPTTEAQIVDLSERLASVAAQANHPEALARAMVDPAAVVVMAQDKQSGVVTPLLQAVAEADPGRYSVQKVIKPEGTLMVLNPEEAVSLGLASRVVVDAGEFYDEFGLNGKTILKQRPTWVDWLVSTLNTPWMSGILLFVGLFMLIVELKLPGIGLPAITSALAFLLFFWSRYLSGTADQLEIILFLLGLICLAIELFVFPGMAVFGMSGIVLILVSVVMASHTFIWPTTSAEYREMTSTVFRIVGVLVGVGAGIGVLARYFPSLPFFNRMILQPEPYIADEEGVGVKPSAASDPALLALVGERGRASTTLRPTGKARFGELLVDVTADGAFIEAHTPIEVIEVRGNRVIVKRA